MDHAAKLSNLTVAKCWQSSELLSEVLERAVEHYNPDLIVLHGDDYIEAESLGVALDWDTGGQPIPIAFPTLMEASSQGLPSPRRFEMLIEAVNMIRFKYPAKPLFLTLRDPFSLAALTAGLEHFLPLLIEDKSEVCAWLDLTQRHQKILAQKIRAAGFGLIVGSPIACCGILHRDHFGRFVYPSLKRLLDVAGERGGFRALHWCGRFNGFNDFLPGLRLDLLSFERLPNSLWNEMPGTVPMGGISASELASDDPEKMRIAMQTTSATLPKPFVLSPSCFVPASLKPEVLCRLFAEYEAYQTVKERNILCSKVGTPYYREALDSGFRRSDEMQVISDFPESQQ